jgi:AAA domain
MKTAVNNPPATVLSLAQLIAEQPAAPPPCWIEPGLLPPQGILFVGGEPKVGKSLLVANLALALASGRDRAGFHGTLTRLLFAGVPTALRRQLFFQLLPMPLNQIHQQRRYRWSAAVFLGTFEGNSI